MEEAMVRLLILAAPRLDTLRREHLIEYGDLLSTLFLADVARVAFEQADARLLEAVNDLLMVANPHVRNLLLTGFVEGVPLHTEDAVIRGLPEPLRSEVARDLGRSL